MALALLSAPSALNVTEPVSYASLLILNLVMASHSLKSKVQPQEPPQSTPNLASQARSQSSKLQNVDRLGPLQHALLLEYPPSLCPTKNLSFKGQATHSSRKFSQIIPAPQGVPEIGLICTTHVNLEYVFVLQLITILCTLWPTGMMKSWRGWSSVSHFLLLL